nr:DUF4245 domain-containing protein [Streptomyces sp. NRRL F-5126]
MAGEEQQGTTARQPKAAERTEGEHAGQERAAQGRPTEAPTPGQRTASVADRPVDDGDGDVADARSGAAEGGASGDGGSAGTAGGAGAGGAGAGGAGAGGAGARGAGAASAKPRRGNRSISGLILSLLVIGAAAAVMYLFIPHNDKATPVKRVDYRVELITARRAAPYPVAAPVGLPKAWKPTSVTYQQDKGAAWHIGFLDPQGQYVAIEQSTAPAKGYVTSVSQNATNTGRTQRVGGEEWQRWKGGHYDALVRRTGKATTVVTGTAPYADLAKMAAALHFEQTKS